MALSNNDVLVVSLSGEYAAQKILFSRTYQCVGASPAGNTLFDDYNDIINTMSIGGLSDIITPYLFCLPPEYTLKEIIVQKIWPVRMAYTSGPINLPGTNGNSANVGFETAAITLRGIAGTRHNVGTMKLGPIPDNVSSGGLLTNAYRTLIVQVLADQLLLGVQPATWGTSFLNPVLFDKQTGNTISIADNIVQTQTRTMRRRVVGRGV